MRNGSVNRSLKHDHCAVIERMRERRRRLNPFETVLIERKRAKKRRANRERINGRAYVVHETRQGELAETNAAAGVLWGFKNSDSPAVLRQGDGGGKPVRSRADNYGV